MVVQSLKYSDKRGKRSNLESKAAIEQQSLVISGVTLNGDVAAENGHILETSSVLNRRSSARIQKLQSHKALLVRQSEQEQHRVIPDKTATNKRRKANPPPDAPTNHSGPGGLDYPGSEKEEKGGSAPAPDECKFVSGDGQNDGESVNLESTQPTAAAAAAAQIGNLNVKSASARVTETLRTFNKHYLHFVQEEEKRVGPDRKTVKGSKFKNKKRLGGDVPEDKRGSKRPDLKAITKMMETRAILYPEKRFGSIRGVEAGHQFFSRAEMVAVGFHSHWLNGIDYIGQGASKEFPGYKLPLAVSIVLSGQYEDDLDNCENVVYTGQGGNNLLGDKRQMRDQVMLRGNLGLKNCMEQLVPVRVIRGHQCKSSYVGKMYTYDGLYMVTNYWAEKGVSGFTVYKFRLKRLEGQPHLTTAQVQFSRGRIPESLSEMRGLVCEDISGGQEDIPIVATNLVDDPPIAPTGLSYCKDIKVAKSVKMPKSGPGCNCKGSCLDPRKCACARLNGTDFPYVHRDGGRLIEPKAVVFECGPNCGCGPTCVNRTSQRGLKYRLEVFRTPKKGWAVRSWDYIPSGAPVCEYIGVVRRTDEIDSMPENCYIFDIDCLQTMKGLDGRERRLGDVKLPPYMDIDDDQISESVPEFCIDAGSTGNVARFINHSCEPNLFVQCVLSSHHDVKLARVVLFAADNIPPLKELAYDYGYALDSVMGPDGKIRKMACFCGAADCRKRLF